MNSEAGNSDCWEIETLEKINELFGLTIEEKDVVSSDFKQWKEYRMNTLSVLTQLQNSLDNIHVGSSTVRAVGSAAGLVGAVTAVIGAGLSTFSNDEDVKSTGDTMMKVGAGVGTVGTAAATTSSVAECGFNYSVLNEIKETLKKDAQITKQLVPWLKRNEELDGLVQQVFGCSVMDDLIKDFFVAIGEINTIREESGKTWEDFKDSLSKEDLENILKNCGGNIAILLKSSGKIVNMLIKFCNNARVRKSLWNLYESYKSSPILFDLSKIFISIAKKLRLLPGTVISQFSTGFGQSLIATTVGFVSGSFLQIISIALNLIEFISAANDLESETSKYSKLVEDVKSFLTMELTAVELFLSLKLTAAKSSPIPME